MGRGNRRGLLLVSRKYDLVKNTWRDAEKKKKKELEGKTKNIKK